ncbi:MAG: M28 family peptidase [Cyclobacteriaceae bacterium]
MSFRFSLTTALFFIIFQVYGQQPHVNILASDTLYGRGYASGGMDKAALYIADRFTEYGVEVLPGMSSYLQEFTHPVNVFPGDLSLTPADGAELMPGRDYLVHPASPSVSGVYDLVYRLGRAPGQQEMIVIEDTFASDKSYIRMMQELESYTASAESPGAGAIMLTDRKLTWHVSIQQVAKPLFIIKKDRWKENTWKLRVEVEAVFEPGFIASNVAGMICGENTDSVVLIGAHYDHLGLMGQNTVFPGANDNASGMAMLLELAEHFSRNKPPVNMVFVAFGSEEAGLIGSRYFTDKPPLDLSRIKLMLNLDLNGTGEDGITVVNGKVLPGVFEKLTELNDEDDLLPAIKARGEAYNSDHCPFYDRGVPAVFIYTLGGIQAYHDIYDKAETLPLTEFTDLKELLIRYITSP